MSEYLISQLTEILRLDKFVSLGRICCEHVCVPDHCLMQLVSIHNGLNVESDILKKESGEWLSSNDLKAVFSFSIIITHVGVKRIIIQKDRAVGAYIRRAVYVIRDLILFSRNGIQNLSEAFVDCLSYGATFRQMDDMYERSNGVDDTSTRNAIRNVAAMVMKNGYLHAENCSFARRLVSLSYANTGLHLNVRVLKTLFSCAIATTDVVICTFQSELVKEVLMSIVKNDKLQNVYLFDLSECVMLHLVPCASGMFERYDQGKLKWNCLTVIRFCDTSPENNNDKLERYQTEVLIDSLCENNCRDTDDRNDGGNSESKTQQSVLYIEIRHLPLILSAKKQISLFETTGTICREAGFVSFPDLYVTSVSRGSATLRDRFICALKSFRQIRMVPFCWKRYSRHSKFKKLLSSIPFLMTTFTEMIICHVALVVRNALMFLGPNPCVRSVENVFSNIDFWGSKTDRICGQAELTMAMKFLSAKMVCIISQRITSPIKWSLSKQEVVTSTLAVLIACNNRV